IYEALDVRASFRQYICMRTTGIRGSGRSGRERSSPAAPHRLGVTYRATASLHPDPRNARTHSKRQVQQIAASIREFGFAVHILVDPEGIVIAGHGRLLAAKLMGLTKLPTIELAGLSDAQKRALRLADNKIALNAGWDLDLLRGELAELSSLDLKIDLSLTGFSMGELGVLLGTEENASHDVIPPVPATPCTRPGDIWRLGDHLIGCGDSCDREFLHRVVGADTRIDAAFLDPQLGSRDISKAASLEGSLRAAAQASRDGAIHFVFTSWQH